MFRINKQYEKKSIKTFLMVAICVITFCIVLSNQKEITANPNDHQTDVWDRFYYNYDFSPNIDYRYMFGQSTYINPNHLPSNPTTQNIRRDRHIADTPLPYGIFSAIIDTYHANILFATWVDEQGVLPFVLNNPNSIADFDTLFLGINNQDWLNPNPLNIFNFGEGQDPIRLNTSTIQSSESQGSNTGFLPPTSFN